MENIVTYLAEESTKKIAEMIDDSIRRLYAQEIGICELAAGIGKALDELGKQIIRNTLETLDEELRRSGERKAGWRIVRRDSRTLMTSLGAVTFPHTLYQVKDGSGSRYLLDELLQLEPDQRLTEDAVAKILREAVETSYGKAGAEVSRSDEVSRQTVKNLIHGLEFPPEGKPEKKREAEVLYIEADEDHVALQFQEKKGDLKRDERGRKINTAIEKLVYIHEGKESGGSREHLKNVHYFSGEYAGEGNRRLWEEVRDYIRENYEEDKIRTIYLGADGGGWIQTTEEVMPGVKFVLDEFHLSKAIVKLTSFLGDSGYDLKEGIKEAIRDNDRKRYEQAIAIIEAESRTESERKRIRDSAEYIRNNWEGAGRRLDRKSGIPGCSAEANVSHVLSSRMSSRPMGWSRRGADRMSHLRAYVKNGGDLLQLAKYQRKAERDRGEAPEEGPKGLSCTMILRSEKNRHPQLGKYVDAVQAHVSNTVQNMHWYKAMQNFGMV